MNVNYLRLTLKALVLFVIANVAWAALTPNVGGISLYNGLVPGRARLPFGENPQSYNLSLFNVRANLASHRADRPPADDEYRVLLIGDSSVWGILLRNDETLAGQVNAGYTTSDDQPITAYNLGYPTISVTKDLLLMQDMPTRYQPDLVIWLTTLEALPATKQVTSPIVQNNPQRVRELITTYDLTIDPDDPAFVDPTWWDTTLIGERRELANIMRLNLYGVMWAATGIDQFYPPDYTPRANDLSADTTFYDVEQPLTADDLALDVIEAGISLWGDVPVVIVNEPMFVADGENSDMRYNFYYPRWAYDDYREVMQAEAETRGWQYLDLWDAAANSEFTNSAIHLTPTGERQLAEAIAQALGWQQP